MKDPAALLYIDTWLTSTSGMDADTRGWYLNLILHQYDKKDLPNDIEELAVLAGVKFSEYKRFEHVFEHVFEQKFKINEKGRLENEIAKEIIRKRESFIDKRSGAGKMSYFLKYIIKNFKPKKDHLQFIKDNVDLSSIDLKNEQMIKHLFEHLSELFINGDGDKDIITWREDFNIYMSELNFEYEKLILDSEFIKSQEEFYPNVDISLSLKKAVTQFWGIDKGWKHKKKQKTKTIDWKDTLTNAIGLNKVYKPRESNGQTFKNNSGGKLAGTYKAAENFAREIEEKNRNFVSPMSKSD